jgi:hypothetical protein
MLVYQRVNLHVIPGHETSPVKPAGDLPSQQEVDDGEGSASGAADFFVGDGEVVNMTRCRAI